MCTSCTYLLLIDVLLLLLDVHLLLLDVHLLHLDVHLLLISVCDSSHATEQRVLGVDVGDDLNHTSHHIAFASTLQIRDHETTEHCRS